jgi:dolichyl-phosphate beta-glucosyltransferase
MGIENIYLSLIIPVFNEESRILKPLPAAIQYLQSTFQKWEVIFVDDGSTDGTPDKLLEAEKLSPSIKILRTPQNHGKGAAVRFGFQQAAGDVLLFSDADFSAPIEECAKLLRRLERGFDVAIGSRGLVESNIEVHQSWPRETMGKVFNLFIRSLLPLEFKDTQCGFKMFRREAAHIIFPRVKVEGFAFDVEVLMIAQFHQLRIAEVPVTWRDVRESKVHPIINSMEMFRDLLRIRYRLAMSEYA